MLQLVPALNAYLALKCLFVLRLTICFHLTQNSWVASSVKTRGIFHSAKVFLFNRFNCKWSVDLPESLRNKTSSLEGHPLCLFRPVGIQNYHSFCGKFTEQNVKPRRYLTLSVPTSYNTKLPFLLRKTAISFNFFGFMLYHVGLCSTNEIVSL